MKLMTNSIRPMWICFYIIFNFIIPKKVFCEILFNCVGNLGEKVKNKKYYSIFNKTYLE